MRYVLHPGYVTSKSDGQEHFIGGPRLARLYGVDMRQCVFGDVSGYREQKGDVHLRPDYHGNYTTIEVSGRSEAELDIAGSTVITRAESSSNNV